MLKKGVKKGDAKSGRNKGKNKGAGWIGKEREEELVVRFYIVLLGEEERGVLAVPIVFRIPRDGKV